MSKVNGLAAIVEEERPTEAPPADAPVQLMLGAGFAPALPVLNAAGPIVAAPDDGEDGGEVAHGERRVGRPPGARNKSTEAWRRFILGLHGSPLQALARIYASDPRELAAYLGCDAREALKRIIEAARVAAPYLHSTMPTEVKVDGRGALAFGVFMQRPGDGQGDAQVEDTDALRALERFAALPPGRLDYVAGTIIENQTLSAPEPGQSNAAQSNAAPESERDQ